MSDLSGSCNGFSCEEFLEDNFSDNGEFFCMISHYFGMICFSLDYRYGKSRSGEKIANSVQLRIRKIPGILLR